MKFARLDKQSGLLGRGIVRFDLRMPDKMVGPAAARAGRADRASGIAAAGLTGWPHRPNRI